MWLDASNYELSGFDAVMAGSTGDSRHQSLAAGDVDGRDKPGHDDT
jgi:hypothetical protein